MPGPGRHDAGHTRGRARTAAVGAGRICGCSRHRCASSWPRSSCCFSRSPSSGGCLPRSACSRYFSNFILLAAFLGIGIGALLGRMKRSLFVWYPALLLGVVAAVYFLRLEVRINAPGSIYFTSGTSDPVTAVETTLLLPVLFVGVAALFAALAQRMAAEMTALRPLRAYTINLAGSLAGVGAFALVSWFEAPPSVWFLVAFAAAAPLLRNRRWTAGALAAVLCLAISGILVFDMQRGTIWSPYYKITVKPLGQETVVEVNNIWHQSMAPVDSKEYFYQWPYMVFGDTFKDVLILGAGSGTDVAAALKHGVRERRRRRNRPGHPPTRPAVAPGPSVLGPARPPGGRRCQAFPEDDGEEVRPRGVRAHRLADSAVRVLRRSPRELHVHRGVVPRRARRAHARRRAGGLQLLPRALARRQAREHGRVGLRRGADGARAPGEGPVGRDGRRPPAQEPLAVSGSRRRRSPRSTRGRRSPRP